MRISDVLRVEYYDYPSDPHFVGNAHVVNFITVQYSHGGYIKAMGIENYFEGTSGQASLNGKLQIRRMTYDIGGGAYYSNCDHAVGADQTETFRLPQPDGSVRVFERHSQTLSSREKTNSFWATAKATYKSQNAMITNTVSVDSWNHPEANQTGNVTYSPEIMETSRYTNRASDDNRSVIYKWYSLCRAATRYLCRHDTPTHIRPRTSCTARAILRRSQAPLSTRPTLHKCSYNTPTTSAAPAV